MFACTSLNNMTRLSKLTSVANLQRKYKQVLNEAKNSGEPVFVLRHSHQEAAVVDIDTFNQITAKADKFDELLALQSLKNSEKELKEGKVKELVSLKDLIDED